MTNKELHKFAILGLITILLATFFGCRSPDKRGSSDTDTHTDAHTDSGTDTGSEGEPSYSILWGKDGELWDPRGRLPDFSYVGYKSGEVDEYAYGPDSANVTDFGAIPDDELSDVAAIQAAIASIDAGVVLIPAGRYIIDMPIYIRKSNIVLRGESDDEKSGTTLYCPYSNEDLKKTFPDEEFSHMINFEGSGQEAGDTYNIVEDARMGDRTLTLEDTSGLHVGDFINIEYLGDHPMDGKLWNHLHNYQNVPWDCSRGWVSGNRGTIMFHIVERIEGKLVTLKEPLRLDVKTSWNPIVKARVDYLTDCGLENLLIEHKHIVTPDHLNEPGYKSAKFYLVFNSWAKNVSIKNADGGILWRWAGYCDMKNIKFLGRGGHSAFSISRSCFCLADSIDYQNYTHWIHSITIIHKANSNVVSNITGITGLPISTDFHRNAPWEALVTELDNTWNYRTGGDQCAGPKAGMRTVFWNMGGDGITSAPEWDDHQTTLVGDLHIPEKFTEEQGWHEHVPNTTPSNLHQAQLERRLNLPKDSLFTKDTEFGDRKNYLERDPSRWHVVDGAYRLYFSDLPPLSGDRLGEYSIYNGASKTNASITANIRTLEDPETNEEADAALIINYQDDENYYFALISASKKSSGIYIVQNGVAELLAQSNLAITNDFQPFTFENKDGTLTLFNDKTAVATTTSKVFIGGKIGFGSRDDAAEFDEIAAGT